MKGLLLGMAVALVGVGLVGRVFGEAEKPANALEKKVEDLSRKIEELQTQLGATRKAVSPRRRQEHSGECCSPPVALAPIVPVRPEDSSPGSGPDNGPVAEPDLPRVEGIVAGRVVNKLSNRGLGNAFIEIVDLQNPQPKEAALRVETDNEGYFYIPNLVKGKHYRLIARTKENGHGLAGHEMVTPPNPKVMIMVTEDPTVGEVAFGPPPLKIEDLNRKIEELQTLLTEIKQAQQPGGCPADKKKDHPKTEDASESNSDPLPGSGGEIHYTTTPNFVVPFLINPAQQIQIWQVMLYVSENGRDYVPAGQAPATATQFQYTAQHQGTFYFVVQAQYKDGRRVPADPRAGQPRLRVTVDTAAPVVALFRQKKPKEGSLAVEWDIRDENPDLLSLRIDYRPTGASDWIPLNLGPNQVYTGRFSWEPAVSAPQYDVRLLAKDMAGNSSEKSLRVTPKKTQQAVSGPSGASPPPAEKRLMVNTRTLRLNFDLFDLGKSQVKLIEVWATQDAQTWSKLTQQELTGPPFPTSIVVQIPAEGRWGFKIIVKSGVGRGEPNPDRGTQPDSWVEVDETKPVVKILATEASGGPENGMMSIRWTAQDKHMADRPISIAYATDSPPQQWTYMANGLSNDGRYDWPIPPDLPHHSCYIKIEAVDLAGNIGIEKTKTMVVTDLSVPTAKIKGVDTVPQPVAPGGMGASFETQPGSGIVPVREIEPQPVTAPGQVQRPGALPSPAIAPPRLISPPSGGAGQTPEAPVPVSPPSP